MRNETNNAQQAPCVSRTRRFLTAAVAALALTAITTAATGTITAPAQAAATASAQGKLINAYTGRAIPGATAHLYRWSGSAWTDTGRAAKTNSQGQYFFGSMHEGYWYYVRGNWALGTSCLYGIYAYSGNTPMFQASGARTGIHAYLRGTQVC